EQAHPRGLRVLPAAVRGAAAELDVPDVRPRREPRRRPPQPPDHRRELLPRARRDPRRQGGGGAQRAVRRQVQVPAHLPAAAEVRPRHGLVLLVQPDRGGVVAGRGPLRGGLAALRHPDGRPAQQRRPHGRQRPAHARRGCAGRRVRRPGGAAGRGEGRRRRPRAEHGPGPGDGVGAQLRPERLRQPRLHGRLGAVGGAQRRPGRPVGQPRHPHHPAARVDVQAGHRGRRDRVGTVRRRLAGAGRVRLPAAPVEREDPQPRRRQLRRQPHHDDPGARGLVQRHVPLPRRRARQRGHGRAGRGVRLQLDRAGGPRRAGRVALPPRHGPALDGAVGHRAVERDRHAAADGDGGGSDRQRRRGDASLRRGGGPCPGRLRARPHRHPGRQQRDLGHHGRGAHHDDGLHGRPGHRHARADPGRAGRRQDGDRPEHGRPAAVRLVRLVRPRRRPPGRGRGPRRGERHDQGGDRWRRPRRADRQGGHGGGDRPV
ncbi:MAG: Cell division protein FtsI [Peptidoglycan synthetase], partial [uncultured Nocardioides sp.]